MNLTSLTQSLLITSRFLILSLLFVSASFVFSFQPSLKPGGLSGLSKPMEGEAAMPQMNDAQMADLQIQLEKEIDDMVSQMTPEQQKVFKETMEKLEKMSETPEGREKLEKLVTGKIEEDELNELLGTLIPQDTTSVSLPIPEERENSTENNATVKSPSNKPTGKIEAALHRINTIVNRINSFLLKFSSNCEIRGKIKDWQSKKLITWTSPETAETLKCQLECLVENLKKLTEPGITAGSYKHIDALLKAESLYNNLEYLEEQLITYEPKIEEASELEVTILSPNSKKAYIALINVFDNALKQMKIVQSIESVLKEFEPTAQKFRESEKKKEEQALQESKKTRPYIKPINAGAKEKNNDEDSYSSYFPSERSYKPYRSDYNSSSAKRNDSLFDIDGSKENSRTTPSRENSSSRSGAKKATEKKDASTNSKKDNQKDDKKESAKDNKDNKIVKKDNNTKSKDTKKIPVKETVKIEVLFDELREKIDSLIKLIANPTLQKIRTHIADTTVPVDIELAHTLRQIEDLINNSLGGILHDLKKLQESAKKNLKTPKEKQELQKKLFQLLVGANNKNLTIIQQILQEIEKIQQEFSVIKDTISSEKLYAYLALDPLGEAKKEAEEKIQTLSHQIEKKAQESDKSIEELLKSEAFIREFKQPMEDASKIIQQPDPLKEIKQQIILPASLFAIATGLLEIQKAIGAFAQ